MADVSWPGGVSDVRGRLGLVAFTAPTVVERLLTADVAGEIARTFGDQLVYPQPIGMDDPVGPSRARSKPATRTRQSRLSRHSRESWIQC